MIISVEELKQHITTDKTDTVLGDMLQALELNIRNYTNNRFHQMPQVRIEVDIRAGVFMSESLIPFNKGDTVQVTIGNNADDCGIYTVKEVTDTTFLVNEEDDDVPDMDNVDVLKVRYKADVKMGVVEIMRWKLKNEAANSGDKKKMQIQSETLSRHSVTYAQDATESDIDEDFGVPKKYLKFLKPYKKARF